MAKTLTQIQTLTRYYGRDDTIDLTTDPGLSIANSVYRNMAAALPWSEFRRTGALTTTTTSGTTSYNWAFSGSEVFTDVKAVEVESGNGTGVYNLMVVADSEWYWNQAGQAAAGTSTYYDRNNVSGTDKLEIRPAPNYTGGNIRVTGIVEPAAFVNGSSTSEFLTDSADNALSHLISASFAVRDGIGDLSQWNVAQATQILQRLLGVEQVPVETVRGIVGQ